MPRKETESKPVYLLLVRGLNRYQRQLNRALLERLCREFDKRPRVADLRRGSRDASLLVYSLFAFLQAKLSETLTTLQDLRRRYNEFAKRIGRAATLNERERQVLEFSRDLGADRKTLRGDKRALSRYFDGEAVTDRFKRRCGEAERMLCFALDRLAVIGEIAINKELNRAKKKDAWERLGIEELLQQFWTYDGDARVRVAAFRCLSRLLSALPEGEKQGCVAQTTLQFIYRSAMHQRQSVWLQCAALSLLENVSGDSLFRVLRQRLHNPGDQADDIFVRKHAAIMAARNVGRLPSLITTIEQVLQDPSPYVRQGLARSLGKYPHVDSVAILCPLVHDDKCHQVRAAAVLAIGDIVLEAPFQEEALRRLIQSLREEQHEFVLRTVLQVCQNMTHDLGGVLPVEWWWEFYEDLERLHVSADSVSVRRWAAQARDVVWSRIEPEAMALSAICHDALRGLRTGATHRVPARLVDTYDEESLGRSLATAVTLDHGLDVRRIWNGYSVTRGQLFQFRLWRFLYEVRHASPDKRQAHSHMVGRYFDGELRIPSTVLAELAQTKVPGEPLFLPEESGWRPYLPLVDDVIASAQHRFRGRATRIYTSEGITTVQPPSSLLRRLAALYRLSTRYPEYARLRNWREGSQVKADGYVRSLEDLGFSIQINPYRGRKGRGDTRVDPKVERFFPAISLAPLVDLWSELREYFFSVFDNSIQELILFSGGVSTYFVGKHILSNVRIRRSRSRIPLIVGGWGTRGKSGTERLKAALFSALGHSMVSKTTGCEAMFLYSHAFGQTKELFLFRPYDKATIWEQSNLLRLASQLEGEVFLWECMALTPAYVRILQQRWMQDDISTITNTYPDHEDLQGPAGFNIPEVMTLFIPRRSTLITTEEVMLPILSEAAKDQETRVQPVTWLEAGLLTDDVLARFPYEEHPNNIALVMALAEELGVDPDFALKEMADRVVADLGVLKVYPVSRVEGRYLEFTNGMSANERHGCLGNWTRLSFDTQDAYESPGVWVTTVVNNRADRVPRSRVFSRILVEDVSADLHFLIGNNLNGLVGYIAEAWEQYHSEFTLWPSGASNEMAKNNFLEQARRLRVPCEEKDVLDRLRAMIPAERLTAEVKSDLESMWRHPIELRDRLVTGGKVDYVDAVISWLERLTEQLDALRDCVKRIETATTDRAQVDQDAERLLWSWFKSKLVVVEDYYTPGDQLVFRIASETPPNYRNRVLGMQNIKGTGLDFVYRWQAWDACYKASQDAVSSDPAVAQRGVNALAEFHDWGLLCEDRMRHVLSELERAKASQSEGFHAQVSLVASDFERTIRSVRDSLGSGTSGQSGMFASVVATLEAFFDAGDAVRRRKMADRIYRDLANERIGYDRAAQELLAIIKRQKGGWLAKRIQGFHEYSSRTVRKLLAQMKSLGFR